MSLEPRSETRSRAAVAATWIGSFVALLWVIELIDTGLSHRLDAHGIEPLGADGLTGIVWAPLLHAGWGHLVSNTGPLLVLGFLLLMSGVREWLRVTAIVWVVGGLGTWLVGGANTIHLGASGLVFGWLANLMVRGFFTRHFGQVALGVVVALAYGSVLWGVLPTTPGVSWQGHLFGALGGVLAAWLAAREASQDQTLRRY